MVNDGVGDHSNSLDWKMKELEKTAWMQLLFLVSNLTLEERKPHTVSRAVDFPTVNGNNIPKPIIASSITIIIAACCHRVRNKQRSWGENPTF